MMRSDEELLAAAIEEAEIGLAEGGIPIGAVLVVDGEVVGAGHNRRGRLPAATYARATMYTTLSPCHMCTGAILLYGIPRVVIGENRTFLGAEDLLRAHGVEVVNLDSPRCIDLMTTFIAEHPGLWLEDIGQVENQYIEDVES
jgi:cytosine/creatinine deaminase